METNFFFVGIQRRRLAAKVQPEAARFEPELDWGKLWRGQVFGELEAGEYPLNEGCCWRDQVFVAVRS